MKKTIKVPFSERQPGDRFETRSGLPCRVLCEDFKDKKPLVAAMQNPDGTEFVRLYIADGRYLTNEPIESEYDLVAVREVEVPDFDLEAAKAGAPVKTKSGLPARIVCFDRISPHYNLVVLLNKGEEISHLYTCEGRFSKDCPHDYDLVMA